jgi:hypothetical protein
MTWLVETPWPVLIAAVIVEAVLAIALLRTGLVKIIGAMVGVLVLALLLVLLERFVVTDFEEVEGTLDEAARRLAANDTEAVLGYISPQATELRRYAEGALRQFTFSEAHVGNDLKVEFNPLTSPPSAEARFTAMITGKDRKNGIGGTRPIQATLILHKINGRWYVADYQPRQ